MKEVEGQRSSIKWTFQCGFFDPCLLLLLLLLHLSLSLSLFLCLLANLLILLFFLLRLREREIWESNGQVFCSVFLPSVGLCWSSGFCKERTSGWFKVHCWVFLLLEMGFGLGFSLRFLGIPKGGRMEKCCWISSPNPFLLCMSNRAFCFSFIFLGFWGCFCFRFLVVCFCVEFCGNEDGFLRYCSVALSWVSLILGFHCFSLFGLENWAVKSWKWWVFFLILGGFLCCKTFWFWGGENENPEVFSSNRSRFPCFSSQLSLFFYWMCRISQFSYEVPGWFICRTTKAVNTTKEDPAKEVPSAETLVLFSHLIPVLFLHFQLRLFLEITVPNQIWPLGHLYFHVIRTVNNFYFFFNLVV